ncbi:MAG: hypothetical protein C0417_08615 [Chlorobiaceae bacterium]|nr:hypothetical protein [Chlorobiaceae bacterium]
MLKEPVSQPEADAPSAIKIGGQVGAENRCRRKSIESSEPTAHPPKAENLSLSAKLCSDKSELRLASITNEALKERSWSSPPMF